MQVSTKGLWSDREKRLHIYVLELKTVSLALKISRTSAKTKQCWLLNSTVVTYINKQGGTHSAQMCVPVEDHDLVPSLQDSCKSQTHSRVPECDGRPTDQVEPSPVYRMVTASAFVQTDLSKWFTPHVDLFATYLNHKVPLYVSPVPDQNAWDIDAPNISWSGLTAYA